MNLKLLKQLKANNVGVAQPHAGREALRVGAFITVTPFFLSVSTSFAKNLLPLLNFYPALKLSINNSINLAAYVNHLDK